VNFFKKREKEEKKICNGLKSQKEKQVAARLAVITALRVIDTQEGKGWGELLEEEFLEEEIRRVCRASALRMKLRFERFHS
jgi:hypothetical protein